MKGVKEFWTKESKKQNKYWKRDSYFATKGRKSGWTAKRKKGPGREGGGMSLRPRKIVRFCSFDFQADNCPFENKGGSRPGRDGMQSEFRGTNCAWQNHMAKIHRKLRNGDSKKNGDREGRDGKTGEKDKNTRQHTGRLQKKSTQRGAQIDERPSTTKNNNIVKKQHKLTQMYKKLNKRSNGNTSVPVVNYWAKSFERSGKE